ncbi:MAG: esterase family protein [Herpetosiphonaceae bacterium]|nr:esterase family protein [Herpetosiphonaceae bacterium]
MTAVPTYQHGPDSQRRPGVPQGSVTRMEHVSTLFPGARREYAVYVPQQYEPATPAAMMVFQDGHAYLNEQGNYRVPVVFDNLIHTGTMPVTIGIFINPGHVADELPSDPWSASNRSFEYDTLSDRYARFLLNEILPEVSAHWNLTTDPEQRAICGASSGGICAFTVAWQRPDAFRKVMSHIGSFADIRGGHVYPSLIRKEAPRPLRVFLQDGEADLDNEWGNWWLANLQMVAALKFRGYDHMFAGGSGGHNGEHGGAILPDSLRWLWRSES